MTINEAHKICREYYQLPNPGEDDDFMLTEALGFLIRETHEAGYMCELGGFYYEKRKFDLALKYYEMASECGDISATVGLGYIWYYGRTGKPDYKKAFYYYDKARQMGDIVASYKVADMYRNGYYVEKDPDKYRSIIEELYEKVENALNLGAPLPEIFTRLAAIRAEEGDSGEALRLYDAARNFLAQRIRWNPFFGNLTIMKGLIRDIYELRPFDPEDIRFYDLYYILRNPALVRFTYYNEEAEPETHEVEAVQEGGDIAIRFDDHWYHNVDDFFGKAELEGELLTRLYEELFDFELMQ